MLANVIDNHNVVSAYMKTDRFIKFCNYYKDLGFTVYHDVADPDYTRIYLTKWEAIARKYLAQYAI